MSAYDGRCDWCGGALSTAGTCGNYWTEAGSYRLIPCVGNKAPYTAPRPRGEGER